MTAPIRLGALDLAGAWQVKVEKSLPPLSDEAKSAQLETK